MKIAFQNAWNQDAETEVINRFIVAGSRIGIEIAEVRSANDILAMDPDFVMTIGRETPKTSDYLYYHVGNLPISHYYQVNENHTVDSPRVIKHFKTLLSFDGCLTNSDDVANFLDATCRTLGKETHIFQNYYSSMYELPYGPVLLDKPVLTYLGIHWDGARFGEMFDHLINDGCDIELYGRIGSWSTGSAEKYKGIIPFDGKSVFEVYRRNGVGLCLHRPEFIRDNMPTNRIFEITASGAVAISSRMPFIESYFGDSVLYVDQEAPAAKMAEQIRDHMQWIAANPREAEALARRAHAIFTDHFTLEVLLRRLCDFHQQVKNRKSYISKSEARPRFEGAAQIFPSLKEVFSAAEGQTDWLLVFDCQAFDQESFAAAMRTVAMQSPRPPAVMFCNFSDGAREDMRHVLANGFGAINACLFEGGVTEALDYLETLQGDMASGPQMISFMNCDSRLFGNYGHLMGQGLKQNPTQDALYGGCVEDNRFANYRMQDRKEMRAINADHDIVFFKTEDGRRLLNMCFLTEAERDNDLVRCFLPSLVMRWSALGNLDVGADYCRDLFRHLRPTFFPEVVCEQKINCPPEDYKSILKDAAKAIGQAVEAGSLCYPILEGRELSAAVMGYFMPPEEV